MHMIGFKTAMVINYFSTVGGHSGHGLPDHVVFCFGVGMNGIVLFVPTAAVNIGDLAGAFAISTGSGHHDTIHVIDAVVSTDVTTQMHTFLDLGMIVMHLGLWSHAESCLADKFSGSHGYTPEELNTLCCAELCVPSSLAVNVPVTVSLLPAPT